MNKLDAALIKADYVKTVGDRIAWFNRVSARLVGTSTELTDLNLLCENFVTSVYVEFECLISDIFHAYINNDNRVWAAFVGSQIKNSVRDKYSAWHAHNLSFDAPVHIKSQDLRRLLDPTNWNITFKDCASLQQRATEWLGTSHATAFSSISSSDIALIDAAHALRNCISHNSESSRRIVNSKLRAIITGLGCTNTELAIAGNNVKTLGKYLRAVTTTGLRATDFAVRLSVIGGAL